MRTKKLFCGLLAMVCLLAGSFPVSARKAGTLDLSAVGIDFDVTDADKMITEEYAVCNSEGDPINNIGSSNGFRGKFEKGELTLEGVNPSQTLYVYLGPDYNHEDLRDYFEDSSGNTPDFTIRTADLANNHVMNLRVNTSGDGKQLVAGVTQYSSKAVGKLARGSWLKIMLFDMAETEETKVDITATFTTKEAGSTHSYSGESFEGGYSSSLKIRLYINNTATGKNSGSGESDNGDRVYYTANKAGGNDFIWGDNRAAIQFNADSNPEDFYCRMSVHPDNQVYSDYGDPVNAELWFYDFVTHPTIPSTNRATLTLGIPWDDDDDYRPNPKTCRNYQQDVMGKLTDVTDLFTFSEDSDPIPGWSMRTRKLESYVVSDVPLPVEEKAEDYSDVYFYSDEELDRIFAIDPAESLRIQASYIGIEVQRRLAEILKGGAGGSDAPNRVDGIVGGAIPDFSEDVSEITEDISTEEVQRRIDEILYGASSNPADEVPDIISGNQ